MTEFVEKENFTPRKVDFEFRSPKPEVFPIGTKIELTAQKTIEKPDGKEEIIPVGTKGEIVNIYRHQFGNI